MAAPASTRCLELPVLRPPSPDSSTYNKYIQNKKAAERNSHSGELPRQLSQSQSKLTVSRRICQADIRLNRLIRRGWRLKAKGSFCEQHTLSPLPDRRASCKRSRDEDSAAHWLNEPMA